MKQKTYFSCCFTGTAQQIPKEHGNKNINTAPTVISEKQNGASTKKGKASTNAKGILSTKGKTAKNSTKGSECS